MSDRALLSVKEFANRVGYSVPTLRLWIKLGYIPVVRMSPRGRLFIPESEVSRMLTPRRQT